MHILRKTMLFTALFATNYVLCQREPMPEKLNPQTIKFLQEQEKQLRDSLENAKKHPGEKFSVLQCRADTQAWTSDPFDKNDARNLTINTAIMVNGQFRSISPITSHVTVTELLKRTYEMEVCKEQDADFEKQFATYSSLSKKYSEERTFRYVYFLLRHHLDAQFMAEDAEANK